MVKCLTKFNTAEDQAKLEDALYYSNFSKQLRKYYRSGDAAPDISLLVSEMNSEILPTFLDGKPNVEDIIETLNEPENGDAINVAFTRLKQVRRQINLNATQPDKDYVKTRGYDLTGKLIVALGGKIQDNLDSIAEKQDIAQAQDDATPLEPMTDKKVDNFIHERNYANLKAYRLDTFKGSSSIENLTVSKFIKDVFLKNAFIDVDRRILVDQTQAPNQPSQIDENLKNYRVALLQDMIKRFNIQDTTSGTIKPLEFTTDLLRYSEFKKILRRLSDAVMTVRYNNSQVSLQTPGMLFEITEEYKRTNHPELKSIIDNFVDFTILSDYNKLFDFYGEGSIDVSRYNDDFDMTLRKYSTQNALSIDAINASWDEQVQNGVKLASPLYKTVINNTEIINHVTGQPTGKFLYPTLVAATFAPYFELIDRANSVQSIRDILMDKLNATNVGRTSKNVLYTIYKTFYEREGDRSVVESKANTDRRNTNKTVNSFYETIRDNKDQSLLELITKPLSETSKASHLEAIEGPDGNPRLSIADVKSKTGVTFTSAGNIVNHINMAYEEMYGTEDDPGFVDKYKIEFVNKAGQASVVKFTSPKTGVTYELRDSENIGHSIEAIKDLSKSFLGLDFNGDRRHQELWEEIQSYTRTNGEVAPLFLAYLKDAFDVFQAKQKLYDKNIQKLIAAANKDGVKGTRNSVTGYSLIDDAIEKDLYFPMADPSKYVFKFQGANAESINDMLYTAENNYTGNQLKSVTPTVDGTTVAGYTVYNYSAGTKQNLAAHRRSLKSAGKIRLENSPLANNLFMGDANFLDKYYIRGSAKIGSTVKGNTVQSDLETLYYNINLGYFGELKRAIDSNTQAKPVFDITVYSDKGQNPLPSVNNTILYDNKQVKMFVTEGKQAVDEENSINMLYATSGQYYRAYGQNILDVWQAVFNQSGSGSVFTKEVLSKKGIAEQLRALNKLNDSKDKAGKPTGFWHTGEFQHSLKGYDAARFYANHAGVSLVNWVHFNNSTKNLGPKTLLSVKPDLVENMAMFENPNKISGAFMKKYNDQLVKFANDLVGMNFQLDDNASSTIAKLYPELIPEDENSIGDFGTEYGMRVTKNGTADKVEDINPAIRKFYYDYNLIQDNLMNVMLGPIYAHKGKDENAMWLTQSKRNVAMTASVRNYSLGLERGVEDATNTAFVDDLVSFSKTILGNSEPVVDFDGASFETMVQRLKTWESLNAKFSGNGGEVHKSFISHFDPKTGIFGETKHAAFAMTYDMIRQSQGNAIDLMEMHKQLYSADISSVDITKSWKDGINLNSFEDVFYYDRTMDFKSGMMGTLHKLEYIRYTGKSAGGKSLYEIGTRNMSLTPGTVDKSPTPVNINTMYDLWHILGGIDSVEETDVPTQHFYKSGNKKVYLTANIKSAEKLLDFESYMGKQGEVIIPEQYTDGSKNAVSRGYKVYQKLFNAEGMVSSHIDLLEKWVGRPLNTTQLNIDLRDHDVKEGAATDFYFLVNKNADDIQDLVSYFKDAVANPNTVVKPYQRFKGKNIDRISFAGAQKVGQYNLNSIETIHAPKRDQYLVNKGISNDPGIPGVTRLMSHKISNFNAGIQLSAWHETDNAVVTTPTQMLNALIFNAKKLGRVQQMYAAIGNIVDKELTYVLGRNNENIPELVRGLSNPQFYKENKDKLLAIFKEIMETKVAKDDGTEFTLESIIVEMFNHKDMPIDDPQIFGSAVAELTNYFTKTGIRTKFDGMFAVLAPGSNILQFHDVQGGFVPVKNELGGFDRVPLRPGEIRTMQAAEYKEYLRLNKHLSEDSDLNIRTHAGTAKALNEQPRNLKGQQVIIKLADGTTRDLSILSDGQKHLIPEAQALDDVKRVITDFKDIFGDKYQQLDGDAKIKFLAKKHKEFLASLEAFRTATTEDGLPKHAAYNHVIDAFQAELESVFKDGTSFKKGIYNFVYDNFSQAKPYRDVQIAKLEIQGAKGLKQLVVHKEHEFIDKLNMVGMLFTGRLQRFLDHADNGYTDLNGQASHIPAALHNKALFDLRTDAEKLSKKELSDDEHAERLLDARVEITRAECIAPITARKEFMLQEGDNINDITEELIHKRLLNTLDYFDVNADAVIRSDNGKKIFLHKGKPTEGTKANDQHPNIREYSGKTWFTNDSGDRLFQVPNDMLVTNINGSLHVFFNDNPEYQLNNNPLLTNLEMGFGKQREKFTVTILGSKEQRLLDKAIEQGKFETRAREIHSSWKVYINKLIGTRVPGQHFQSFQGMKIVGFSGSNSADPLKSSNNIYVANEVILLSGADFDIDKQNIIYHSINGEGKLSEWHPAFDYSSEEALEESLRLPMPSKRTADAFITEFGPLGESVDEVIPDPDNAEPTVYELNRIYALLEKGYKLHPELHPQLIAKLVEYENADVSINGVKNFAVSNTNQIIESPSNFLYLSNGVTTDTVKQYSNRTPKAAIANEARKENPVSQARQKGTNMVGRQGIGIMASQMKVLSAVTYTTNTALQQINDLYKKSQRMSEMVEGYIYHLSVIENPQSHYTGPHTQEQLENGVRQLNDRIKTLNSQIAYLISATGGPDIRLPNVNYGLLNENFANGGPFKTLHRTGNSDKIKDGQKLAHAKVASMFDVDVADIDSQKLSSATDNAKELDLGKLNATPELMTLYPSASLRGISDEEMVTIMTSPMVDMFIRNATKNVYDKATSQNSVSKLLTAVSEAMKEGESDFKSLSIMTLAENFNLTFLPAEAMLRDITTGEMYDALEIVAFNEDHFKPAQITTLLAKYLGINQGIPSNSWDLYTFATSLQDTVNAMLYKAKKYTTQIDMKKFLDSIEKGDSYYKTMIAVTSPLFNKMKLVFNPLHVLASNPHFAKQLSAFNASNTILKESSYRVESMYHMVAKLRDMGYLGPHQAIKKPDFQEVEKFIESTIIHTFITNERENNAKNQKERPIFYDGNKAMYLDNEDDRELFVKWMQTKFYKRLADLDTLKGNAFIQDLRIDNKQDPLLFDKVDFMKLQMDTTNVKSNVEQGPFRDAYVAGLKQVYEKNLTDLQSVNEDKQNNIFNALFWYNLIVNKNNITKNSYAKLLGDVMWQNGPSENVYSRLFLLKGKIGKSTSVELNLGADPEDDEDFYEMEIGGITFNMNDLIYNFEIGNVDRLGADDEDGGYSFNDDGNQDAEFGGGDEPYDPATAGSTDDGTSEISENFAAGDDAGGDFDSTDADSQKAPPRNFMSITRTKQKNVKGTSVSVTVNGETTEQHIERATTYLPISSDGFIEDSIGYNPFVEKPVELRPDQEEAFMFHQLAIGNIHELLSRLGDAVTVTITRNGVEEKFDPSKDYEC